MAKAKGRAARPTPKQQAFAAEFLANGRNASAAYRSVYSAGRMSDDAVRKEASRLLKNPHVAPTVRAAVEKAAEAVEVTAEWVLQKLKTEAEDKGEGASQSARIRALELLGKHIGMFAEKKPEGAVRARITTVEVLLPHD